MKQVANAVVRFTSYQFLLEQVLSQLKDRPAQASTLGPGIAGALAGAITVYATMPFDVVKTSMQALGGKDAYRGSLDCLQSVVKSGGVRSLWKGTTPRLVRLSVSQPKVLHSIHSLTFDRSPEWSPSRYMSMSLPGLQQG